MRIVWQRKSFLWLLALGMTVGAPVASFAQPSNDSCANPASLAPIFGGPSVGANTNTLGASTDGPVLAGACASGGGTDQIYNDIWYCWTAPLTESVTINAADLIASPAVPRVAVYTGCACPTAADVIDCAENDIISAQVIVDVTAGESYLIQVGTSDPAAFLQFVEVSVSPTPPPVLSVANLTCAITGPDQIELTWDPQPLLSFFPYDQYSIFVDGVLADTVTGSPTSYTFTAPGGLAAQYEFCIEGGFSIPVVVIDGVESACCTVSTGIVMAQFRRGDANNDGAFNLADAVAILTVLFPNGTPLVPECDDALDANDDGSLNLADVVRLLGELFPSAGPNPLSAPGSSTCGSDPTSDSLDCVNYNPLNCP